MPSVGSDSIGPAPLENLAASFCGQQQVCFLHQEAWLSWPLRLKKADIPGREGGEGQGGQPGGVWEGEGGVGGGGRCVWGGGHVVSSDTHIQHHATPHHGHSSTPSYPQPLVRTTQVPPATSSTPGTPSH